MRTLEELEQYVTGSIAASPKLRKLSDQKLLSFAVHGMNEEAGEVAGLMCREVYKDIDMPEDRWLEEIGDTLWYTVAAAAIRGFTLEQLVEYNEKKLEARYGKR